MLTPGMLVLDNVLAFDIPVDGALLVAEVSPSAEDTLTLPPVSEVTVVMVVVARLLELVTLLEWSYEC